LISAANFYIKKNQHKHGIKSNTKTTNKLKAPLHQLMGNH